MHTLRNKENAIMEHTGYLGTSRVVINHYDVSTQADIQHVALSYESEDEMMARLQTDKKRTTAHYSKQDIREQYCISDRGLGALESDHRSLFGCLSSRQDSPCSTRASFLTACVRQKVPSDENLYELYRRHDRAPLPRQKRYPFAHVAPEIYRYDRDLKSSYFRRKTATVSDPSRYTWMPSDDESVGMEKPRSVLEPAAYTNQVGQSKKHVSFARSHTLASFDDAMTSLESSSSHLNRMTRSQERLLDVRKMEMIPITRQPAISQDNHIFIDKVKRAPMKTQATQTEVCLGRKPLPPGNINLSPRTIHRVKMVSQGAQTNDPNPNGRKLIKSYSEACTKFSGKLPNDPAVSAPEHEPLQRTQSDEPPRSPYIPSPPNKSETSESSSTHDSDESESKKEIFIDFKPNQSGTVQKKPLMKTASDGEILLERRHHQKDERMISYSHENIVGVSDELEERSFTPYFQKAPIRNEGICLRLDATTVYSSLEESNLQTQDSVDEEFHENFIYNRMYVKNEGVLKEIVDECVVPSVCFPIEYRLSPFASNDSLANDPRDHSDGIWNESQATVLQADSGTDNGTGMSSSEMASITSPGSANLLTPSSRRKHLLMLQHQQRSSMDTEALDEEEQQQQQIETISPRIIVEKQPIKQQYLTTTSTIQRTISPPIWKKRTIPETPSESPQPAIVPDLLLARTDSCKTNTDVSESTTTDDYITANSGTDSSRKSGSIKGVDYYNLQPQLHDGSSFESSSKGEDMVVPTFTPPSIPDDVSRSLSNTPVPEVVPVLATTMTTTVIATATTTRHGRSSPSDDTSSSCGSYSVDGSCPDLLERTTDNNNEVPLTKAAAAIVKRSVSDEEDTKHRPHYSSSYYESPIEDDTSSWHPDARPSPQRRPHTLDVVRPPDAPKRDTRLSPNEKPKRGKTRTRSPMQKPKKHTADASDESSCDMPGRAGPQPPSPRKPRKGKETARRKSLPRSPTAPRTPDKPSSLPGSLSRRRRSPPPPPAAQAPKSPETGRLKALSAESLRSVSPGSDSVFYSEPSSHATEHQVHCLHCGKEVELVAADKVEDNREEEAIVRPPAGFEDSPRATKPGRLYKKLDRRFRSEERSQNDHRRHRYKPDARAKSEERGAKSYRGKLRPMARSNDSSQEGLKATDSSPSVLPGAPDDEDDHGVYDVPYLDGCWVYVDEREEVMGWNGADCGALRRDSISSTESEQDFRKRYQAITHRMVHRKSCLEMYKRQTSRSFANGNADESPNETNHLRNKLEEILKLMLVIWCRENQALNLISSNPSECDKTVVVRRESGEFGFRIHGSKPVVVSAIEPGTPAESSGLEVGDIVLAVNGISVLDKSHSEVVKIAHAGSDTLTLEVARTCYALNDTTNTDHSSPALFSGYLWKLSGYASGVTTNKWIRRWFCLKQNNCLYYYKTDSEKQPVGVVMLFDQEVRPIEENGNGPTKPHRFVIEKADTVALHLAADNSSAQNRWLEVIGNAIGDCRTIDRFLDETKRNANMSAGAILEPDCFGYLIKLGTQWKSWSRRYCVLKDACLYFYQDINAKNAFGVAYLQGYRVQQSLSGSKKHAFEIIPPDPSKKHYYFHTESDADRKRWIAALEYSIDRWLKLQ